MIEALGTKLVIERVEQEQTSSSGIILSNQQDNNPLARILSVGSQVKITVAVNDLAVVSWSSTAEKKYQGKTYYLIDETGVFGRTHNA
jgi:co-chaperonin GroES (HSP10)